MMSMLFFLKRYGLPSELIQHTASYFSKNDFVIFSKQLIKSIEAKNNV